MDSEARICTSMQAAFMDCGLPPPSREQIKEIIGLALNLAAVSLLTGPDERHLAAVVERYRHHYLGANQTPTPLFPGVPEVLQELRDQGYWLAVATGKSRRGLDQAMHQSGLAGAFLTTRCADEAPSKPHPQMVLEILDELGVAPQEAVMIGDTEYDVQMAIAAGVLPVAVGYGVHGCERLQALGPAVCLDTIEQLPRWLRQAATPLGRRGS